MRTALQCHPSESCAIIHAFDASIDRLADSVLSLRYTIEGEIGRILVPRAEDPVRTDGLWRHTCFELFVGSRQTERYLEINLSPSRRWAAYGFDAYRSGMADLPMNAPRIDVRIRPEAFELDAEIQLDSVDFPVDFPNAACALCAVIEDRDGRRSHWAVRHPVDKPDFHHFDAFTLALPSDGISP